MGYNDDIKMLIDAQDLTLPPPEREPQRQYYFIKKCREIVKKKSEELGRPLYACSVCMGCQMNTEHEIEKSRINAAFFVGVEI